MMENKSAATPTTSTNKTSRRIPLFITTSEMKKDTSSWKQSVKPARIEAPWLESTSAKRQRMSSEKQPQSFYNPTQDLKQPKLMTPTQPLLVLEQQPTVGSSNILKSVRVTDDLKFSLENGPFGNFYRIRRGSKWFAISEPQWWQIVDNKKQIVKNGNVLTLTKRKHIRTEKFQETFIAMHHTFKRDDGTIFDACLVITPAEFGMLLHESTNIANCLKCKNEVKACQLIDGRMKKTELSSEKLLAVELNNDNAENQLGMQCTYCGSQWEIGVCHCHEYNCIDCEPKNFCEQCNRLTVRPSTTPMEAATTRGDVGTL